MIFPQDWGIDGIDTESCEIKGTCWSDIFYNDDYPTTAYQITGTNDKGFIYFRMRLKDNPLDEDLTKLNILKETLWGIQIKSETDDIIFTIRIYPFENKNIIEILDSSDITIYSEPVVFANEPELVNLEITKNDPIMGSSSSSINPNYFLDFKLPRNSFTKNNKIFDFEKEIFKLYDFSSNEVDSSSCNCNCNCDCDVRPSMEITKELVNGDNPICKGEEGSWELQITVTNPLKNFESLVDIVVEDYINTDLEITNMTTIPSSGNAIFDSGEKKITWTIPSLAVGASATLTINLSGIFSVAGSEVLNTGSGIGRGAKTCLYTKKVQFDVEPITVEECEQPSLEIIKELIRGDNPICKGEEGTWELKITVTNPPENIEALVDIVVEDYINTDLEITNMTTIPSSGNAIFDSSEKKITWTIPSLAVGASATLTINLSGVFSEIGSEVLNIGRGIGKGAITGLYTPEVDFDVEPISVIECKQPSLKIIKELISGDNPICKGEEGTWELQITVTNPPENIETLVDIVVEDYLNPDLDITNINLMPSSGNAEFDSMEKKITWTIPSLAVGASATLSIDLSGIFSLLGEKILDIGTGIGKGAITGLYTPEVDFDVEPINVIECTQPSLEIIKELISGDNPICKGEEGSWELQITVTNPLENIEALVDIVVEDYINSDLEITNINLMPSSGNAEFDSMEKKITWTIPSLEVGGSATLTIDLSGIFSEVGSEVLNTGSGIGKGSITGLYTPQVDFDVEPISVIECTQPSLEIIKELISGDDPVCVGEEGTWELQITVTNPPDNIETLVDIVVEDYINPDLDITNITIIPSSGIANFDLMNKKITWIIPSLEIGASAILTIKLAGIFSEIGKKTLNVGSGIGKGEITGLYTPQVDFDVEPITVEGCLFPTRGVDLFATIE